jgi:catechol 2,3-dioxygenase-like lactoylglutathione lyase family enzyme
MSGVIDHVGIRVRDLAISRRMYEAALGELGFTALGEGEFEGDPMSCSGAARATTSHSTLSGSSRVETASRPRRTSRS